MGGADLVLDAQPAVREVEDDAVEGAVQHRRLARLAPAGGEGGGRGKRGREKRKRIGDKLLVKDKHRCRESTTLCAFISNALVFGRMHGGAHRHRQ